MILTGAKLDEMGRAIWGADWPSTLARRLKRSRQTLFNWRDKPIGLSTEIKRELLAVAEDQLATVAEYVNALKEDLGA